MGIPKFFRWMSERYPMCSQVIKENSIPEFDNLYLDMNGIVHNCSHNNNDSAHFRITEDQIWIGIFNYIEHLFNKIKPKKLFFLAIDGVAPRAKMNQQRSRRFRTAKDAEDTRKEALRKGEELPPDDPFDSNCITPGTEFMVKLSLHLRYFIAKKVSEDADWRDVKIVLSGPEVPGEGEHKIMEYIRLARAQPDYNPNTRHCLYGLDADLIMLGLLSHEPHFALLREEVTFGKQNKRKAKSLDAQDFYLMHLSLLREYLEMEFDALKRTLKSEYDLERVIDDFILLALFVGNDFLPHLPHVHIHEGALGLMFNSYKEVRPSCSGYLQDSGNVNMENLQKVLDKLAESVEKDAYEAEAIDLLYLAGKRGNGLAERETLHKLEKKKKGFTMTQREKDHFEKVKEYLANHKPGDTERLYFDSACNALERKFIKTLATKLHLDSTTEFSDDKTEQVYIQFMESGDEEDEDAESAAAIQRVLEKYEKADIVDDISGEELARLEQEAFDRGFKEWKAQYYKEKMKIDIDNEEQMEHLVKSYINGIQWVLHYYYKGVGSWGWFYPYHYAPRISDLVRIVRFKDPNFQLGQPFKPHEQLMGVLPSLSSKLLPEAYRTLMTEPTSPIIDFYPKDFLMDMNGKKQDWEAVVKIPFIDEERLLAAMKGREHRLTQNERKMSVFGECYLFEYDEELARDENNHKVYHSSLPRIFPDIHQCCTREKRFHLPTLDGGLTLKKHLLEGAFLGKEALAGFPSLHTINHKHHVEKIGIDVFQQSSKNDSVVVELQLEPPKQDLDSLAKQFIQKPVYVGYPYLCEAIVVAVSSEEGIRKFDIHKNKIVSIQHDDKQKKEWHNDMDGVAYMCKTRRGLLLGETEFAFHTCAIRGMREDRGALVKEYVSPVHAEATPMQMIVFDVKHPDPRHKEKPALPYEIGSHVLFVPKEDTMAYRYGAVGKVIDYNAEAKEVSFTTIVPNDKNTWMEATFGYEAAQRQKDALEYKSPQNLTDLELSALHLSKLTSSVRIRVSSKSKPIDIGLNLKSQKKELMVPNYVRFVAPAPSVKNSKGYWEYSTLAITLVQEYLEKFKSYLRPVLDHTGKDMAVADFYWGSNAKEVTKEMKEWLKRNKIDELPQVSIHSAMLQESYTKEVEEAATRLYEETKEYQELTLKHVPLEEVMKASLAEYMLQGQELSLGDRVVYSLESGPVPIDSRGTVVGVLDKVVEVVFDEEVMSANTLDGRCSEYRGLALPVNHVLRLKTCKDFERKKSTELTSRGQTKEHTRANPTKSHGPSRKGIGYHGPNHRPVQETSPPSPPSTNGQPPLQASSRGHHGHGRGQGRHETRGSTRGRGRGRGGSQGQGPSEGQTHDKVPKILQRKQQALP